MSVAYGHPSPSVRALHSSLLAQCSSATHLGPLRSHRRSPSTSMYILIRSLSCVSPPMFLVTMSWTSSSFASDSPCCLWLCASLYHLRFVSSLRWPSLRLERRSFFIHATLRILPHSFSLSLCFALPCVHIVPTGHGPNHPPTSSKKPVSLFFVFFSLSFSALDFVLHLSSSSMFSISFPPPRSFPDIMHHHVSSSQYLQLPKAQLISCRPLFLPSHCFFCFLQCSYPHSSRHALAVVSSCALFCHSCLECFFPYFRLGRWLLRSVPFVSLLDRRQRCAFGCVSLFSSLSSVESMSRCGSQSMYYCNCRDGKKFKLHKLCGCSCYYMVVNGYT